MNRHLNRGIAAAAAYVGTVVLANVLSSHYGFVSVGFGLAASAGTYCAGLALGLRDIVQETLGRWGVLAVIVIGSLLSYLLANPLISSASLAAFALAELCDWGVYDPLRERGLALAVLLSNVVGAVVDTVVFLWLAPFPLTAAGVAGQLVGKVLWATAVPLLVFLGLRHLRHRSAVSA